MLRVNEFSETGDIDGSVSAGEAIQLLTLGFNEETAGVYVAPTAPTSTRSKSSIKINGKNLMDFGFLLQSYPSTILLPDIRTRYQQVNWNSGNRSHGNNYGNISFTIDGVINANTHQDFVTKLDSLKQWIDIIQYQQYQYVVNSRPLHGLMFEISGHKYWYDTGTITGTTSSKILAGNNTLWTKYLDANSDLEIEGHTVTYRINNVYSDTIIELDSFLQSDATTANYRAERKRFLIVELDGASSISAYSDRGFLSHSAIGKTYTTKGSNVYRVSISFSAAYPFWISHPHTQKLSSITSNTFLELQGVGNTMSAPVYEIKGCDNGTKVAACEIAFNSTFHYTTNARDVYNINDISPHATGVVSYDSSDSVVGIRVDSDRRFYYNSLVGNSSKFGFLVRVVPYFNSDDAFTANKYLFDFFDHTGNNGFRAYYDMSTDKFNFVIRSGGTDDTLTATQISRFGANRFLEIGGWYDSDGRVIDGTTCYSKMFAMGTEIASSTSSIAAPTSYPTGLLVGSHVIDAATGTAQEYWNGIIGELVLFVYAPTDDEFGKFYANQYPIFNNNGSITVGSDIQSYESLKIFAGKRNIKTDINNGTQSYFIADGHDMYIIPTNNEERQQILLSPSTNCDSFEVVVTPHFR